MVQLQLENGVCLNGGKTLLRIELGGAACSIDVNLLAGKVSNQIFTGIGTVGAATNDSNDIVQVIQRGQIAFKDVLTIARLGQQIRRAPADHIYAVVDEIFDRLHQAHFPGLAVHHRKQNHAEAFLHLGMLEQLIEHQLRLAIPLQLDHNAHTIAVALIANIRNIIDYFVVYELSDSLYQPRFVHLIGNLGDDDSLAIFVEGFDAGLGSHHETASTIFVGIHDSRAAMNDAGGREIGALHEFQNLRELSGWIVDQSDSGVHDLSEIVRRNFRRHPNRDPV